MLTAAPNKIFKSQNFVLQICSKIVLNITVVVEVDECHSNPCVNGECIDQIKGFMCNCSDGYYGAHCECKLAYITFFVNSVMPGPFNIIVCT